MRHRDLSPWIVLAALALSAGCQSYEPAPLDLPAHRAAWLARGADAPGAREFAARLSAGGADRPFDAADGLELREAEAVALFFNPDLRVARLRAGVAAATAENAGLWDDPVLSVDTMRVLESVEEPWKIFASIGLTLPISGRLGAEKERAGAEHSAELVRIAAEEWGVRVALRMAWAEWSGLVAKRDATREFLGRLEQVAGIV
ncbi:MAG: hypothetical protein IT281_09940, partial [Ignavibacteria bacterium]|nr:hypothetical protein [Ignavibacteria bacterium]